MPLISERFIKSLVLYLSSIQRSVVGEIDDTFDMNRIERLGAIHLQINNVIEALKKIK